MMTKALYYGLKSPQLWALNKPGYAASLVSTPLGKTQILDMKRDLDQPSNNYSSKAYLTNYENSRVPVFLPKECMSINPATIQSQYNCIIIYHTLLIFVGVLAGVPINLLKERPKRKG